MSRLDNRLTTCPTRPLFKWGAVWFIDLDSTATIDTHGSTRTTDQHRTRIGAGTLRRNGDPDSHGLHVCDTRLKADTMTMTPNVTTT